MFVADSQPGNIKIQHPHSGKSIGSTEALSLNINCRKPVAGAKSGQSQAKSTASMKSAVASKPKNQDKKVETPVSQLSGFIDKFESKNAALVRGALKVLRKRFPTAVELVYDNYNALAIGWSPNERASEVIVSLAVFARGATLYFTQGKKLPDPQGLLQGNGNQGRFLRLDNLELFSRPSTKAFLRAAEALGKTPLPKIRRGYIVIKSISVKQRPRRPQS